MYEIGYEWDEVSRTKCMVTGGALAPPDEDSSLFTVPSLYQYGAKASEYSSYCEEYNKYQTIHIIE